MPLVLEPFGRVLLDKQGWKQVGLGGLCFEHPDDIGVQALAQGDEDRIHRRLHDRTSRRRFDRELNLRPQRVATAQLAGINQCARG